MDKRTILAFFLIFLVLLGFQFYMAATMPEPPKPPPAGGGPGEAAGGGAPGAAGPRPGAAAATAGTPTATAGAPAIGPAEAPGSLGAVSPGAPGAPLAPTPTAAAFAAPVRDLHVENDVIAARFTTAGGEIRDLRLRRYFAEDQKTPLELLRPFDDPVEVPALELAVRPSDEPLDAAPWEANEAQGSIVFARPATAALAVEKVVTLARAPDGYHFDVIVRLENRGAVPVATGYTLVGAGGITFDDPTGASPILGAYGVPKGESTVELETLDASKLPEPKTAEKREIAGVTYGGVSSKYFAIVLAPITSGIDATFFLEQVQGSVAADGRTTKANVRSGFRVKEVQIPPGHRLEHRWLFFAGPKESRVLEGYKTYQGRLVGLPTLLDMSSVIPGAESLSRLFLSILHAFYRFAHSYGIAVILLTILVRLALHPLSRASQRSMYKMQKLGPAVNRIREKYKGKKSKEAAQKMNVEIMELYKAHGANPIAGCLPMFLQLPVFIGLYNAIAYSIELRQTHFLWIDDLSLPDRLISLGFNLPWPLEGYVNLLPILMVLTMVAQQKMQPMPPDPQQQQQQKMMGYMVIIFGVLFYTVPSGLVLYFFTSSLLGIAEQKWVRHQLEKEEAAGKFKV